MPTHHPKTQLQLTLLDHFVADLNHFSPSLTITRAAAAITGTVTDKFQTIQGLCNFICTCIPLLTSYLVYFVSNLSGIVSSSPYFYVKDSMVSKVHRLGSRARWKLLCSEGTCWSMEGGSLPGGGIGTYSYVTLQSPPQILRLLS
jgi:hypothetical protein